jgi:hypothetical protein
MRPIGKHVRRVLEILEECGPSTYLQVFERMSVPKPNVSKYCVRAVEMGLATADNSVKPKLYAAVKGWRETEQARRKMYQRPDATYGHRIAPGVGAHNPFNL